MSTTRSGVHPGIGYDIHPIFYDLLDGLGFDFKVGDSHIPWPNMHINATPETVRKFGDPNQPNYIRPHL